MGEMISEMMHTSLKIVYAIDIVDYFTPKQIEKVFVSWVGLPEVFVKKQLSSFSSRSSHFQRFLKHHFFHTYVLFFLILKINLFSANLYSTRQILSKIFRCASNSLNRILIRKTKIGFWLIKQSHTKIEQTNKRNLKNLNCKDFIDMNL